ncbi:hypothetical protein SDC9_132966 [bioreactor metagenome]|uniref:Uncharacterized protein n=1 Tax=bioreactor metagenome TaxID=1076179 RepID=A0A645DAD6_9ZZZZ
MRLPTIDNNDAEIDEKDTAKMVAYAMEHGSYEVIKRFLEAYGINGNGGG